MGLSCLGWWVLVGLVLASRRLPMWVSWLGVMVEAIHWVGEHTLERMRHIASVVVEPCGVGVSLCSCLCVVVCVVSDAMLRSDMSCGIKGATSHARQSVW